MAAGLRCDGEGMRVARAMVVWMADCKWSQTLRKGGNDEVLACSSRLWRSAEAESHENPRLVSCGAEKSSLVIVQECHLHQPLFHHPRPCLGDDTRACCIAHARFSDVDSHQLGGIWQENGAEGRSSPSTCPAARCTEAIQPHLRLERADECCAAVSTSNTIYTAYTERRIAYTTRCNSTSFHLTHAIRIAVSASRPIPWTDRYSNTNSNSITDSNTN